MRKQHKIRSILSVVRQVKLISQETLYRKILNFFQGKSTLLHRYYCFTADP